MKARRIDPLLQISVFVAAVCLLTPVEMFLFAGTLRRWFVCTPLITGILVIMGFAMQTICAGASGHARPVRGESGEDGMRAAHAIVPILAALGLTALSFPLYQEIYYRTTIVSTDLYLVDSLYPYMAAGATFLSLLVGIALWFYPPDRLVNVNMIPPFFGAAVYLALFLASSSGIYTVMCTVCFFLFVVCVLLLLNQSHITRGYRGSVVSVMTPEARAYNVQLILYMILMMLLTFGLAYIVLSGFATLGRMLLFTTLYQLLHRDASGDAERYYDATEASGKFHEVVFRSSPLAESVFYVFLLLLALFVVLVVLRKIPSVAAAVLVWLRSALDFLFSERGLRKAEKVEILNYTDEESKIQRASVRDYHAMAEKSDRYEDFLTRLRLLPTAEEQLSFAYAMMLHACRKAGIPLKMSDTPREAYRKISRYDIDDAKELTDAFELVKYGELDLGERTAAAIRSICAVVKKYMY